MPQKISFSAFKLWPILSAMITVIKDVIKDRWNKKFVKNISIYANKLAGIWNTV